MENQCLHMNQLSAPSGRHIFIACQNTLFMIYVYYIFLESFQCTESPNHQPKTTKKIIVK